MINTQISFVTGIWDLDRDDLSDGWKRSFEYYINNFIRLLESMKDHNLYIFIDPKHEHIVWEHRDKKNTFVIHHTKADFNGNFFHSLIKFKVSEKTKSGVVLRLG